MITQRGIEVNPKKNKAINSMHSLISLKDVQVLAGQIVAINMFVSTLEEMCFHFFRLLRKVNTTEFQWIEECEEAFQDLKEYLSRPLVLSRPNEGEKLLFYLVTSIGVVSLVLIILKDQNNCIYTM